MKQLRLALAVTALCVALGTTTAPAYADVVVPSDIEITASLKPDTGVIPEGNIVLLPDSGATIFFFEVSVTNRSGYELSFDYVYDPDRFMQVSGISVPLLYNAQGVNDPPLGGLLLMSSLNTNTCGQGISLSCLHAGETFSGPIAFGFVGSNTAPGLYAFTDAGLGSPATMSFEATYVFDHQQYSVTQTSPEILVNVVAQNAVPEAHPWVLLMAGLASVLLISTRRIRN